MHYLEIPSVYIVIEIARVMNPKFISLFKYINYRYLESGNKEN